MQSNFYEYLYILIKKEDLQDIFKYKIVIPKNASVFTNLNCYIWAYIFT